MNEELHNEDEVPAVPVEGDEPAPGVDLDPVETEDDLADLDDDEVEAPDDLPGESLDDEE